MEIHDFFALVNSKILKDVPIALTIGVFDGVHRGHEDIFNKVKEYALTHPGTKTMVITFSQNPKIKGQMFVDTLRLREEYIASFGINYFTLIDFCKEISKISGNEFIRLLCTMCRVKAVVVGEDFKCGTPNSQVTAKELEKEFESTGNSVDVFIRETIMDDQVRISSTLLRQMIQKGDLDGVKRLSGRPYVIDLVEKAIIDNKSLTFATSSINQVLPPFGTYKALLKLKSGNSIACKVTIDESKLMIDKNEKDVESLSIITKEL